MNKKVDTTEVISWDKAYCLGHEKIDKEHKRLFEIALDINKYANDSKMIMKMIKELIKYTKIHFINEENFMKSISYKNIKEHKKLHKKLVEKLSSIINDINFKPLNEIVHRLTKLVNKDIIHHILVEDKKVHHSIKSREELKNHFRWKNEYRLRNELLDDEHQQLFDIAVEALDYNNTDIKSHIKITINELFDYMKTHFEHEEKYMQEIAYPDFNEHKLLHENIINQMNEFIKQLSSLKIVDFERKLIEYIDIWLINHILHEDKKIIKFLKN